MSAEKNDRTTLGEDSLMNRELYRIFVSQSSEGIWRMELEQPAAISLPANEQIEHLYRYAYLAECNPAMARMYGYESPQEIIGARFGDLLIREDEANIEHLVSLIKSGYRMEDAESHEVDRNGNSKFFLNNLTGVIDNGFLLRLWGTQRDITERKEVELSKAHLAAIVESSDDAIVSKDLRGDITSWNKGAEKMFGYRAEEIIGRPIAILIPPHLIAEESHFLEIIKNDKSVKHYETVRARKDRTHVAISLTVSPIKNEAGEIIGASKIARDISERKQAEENLRESQAILALSMRSGRMGAWWRDFPSETVWWSPELEEIFGLESGAFRGTEKDFFDFVHEDDREGIWNEISRAIDERREYSIEFRFRHTDGSIRWMEGRGKAVYSEKGDPVRLYGIGIDITERRKSEEQLRDSEERFAKAFNSSPLALTITALKTGKLIEVNETFVRVTGYARGEAIGRTTAELGLWANAKDREKELEKVQKLGEIRDLEYRFRLKNGGEIIGLLSAELIEIGGEPCSLTIIQDITERRRNEEIARRSMQQMALVTDIAPVFIANCSRDMRFKFVNKAYAERFGMKPEECVGKRIVEILGKEAFGRISPYIKTVLDGQKVEFEEVIAYPTIGEHFMHCSCAPEFDEKGEVIGLVVAITDISERRKMEEALRESESRFRTMTNSAPMLVWMSGTDKLSEYFNQTWLDFTGRTMEQEIANGWMEGIHPDDLERCLKVFSDTYDAREGFEIEYRLRRFDGEYRWILDKGVPLFTQNGVFRGYIGSCFDVTERREGQEALLRAERRASEEYLELLARIVPVAQTLGAARDLTSIYRALHEFVRASMPCSAFFVSFYDAARNLRTAAYVCGEEGEVDISLLPPLPLTPDGGPNSRAIFEKRSIVVNRYWDLMKTRPHVVLNEDGNDPHSSLVVPMTALNRITGTLEVQAYEPDAFTNEHIIALEMVANLAAVAIENVRLLQIEAEARETAEAANRAKDEFLSVLSHELRTPLNSMLGWTRMLRTGILDEEKSKRAIEVIERNTLLQNNLIEDLLDVSRIISGKMKIEKESVDLAKVFADAVEILRPVAAQKNIEFDAAAPDSALMIEGDATRFQQIVVNLIQNAVKFTPEGGKISASLRRSDNSARLVVSDNGIGINEELLPFIFDRFRQADSSTKRAYSGLGLGLTIVRNLVELHGGTIRAESAGTDRGATFTVEIPLTEEFLEKTSSKSQSPLFAEDAALAGARILLVDDDADSLVPLQIFLEKENAEIETATSAKEALEKLAAHDFHILITDIGMPLADGYDLIARVRQLQTEQNAFITAIALTAYASSDDRRRALAAGFQGHLAKPVDFDELLAVIKGFYEKVK